MPRSSRPDSEGYFYFAQVGNYLYGPYSQRATAAGVWTQMSQGWHNRPTIYDFKTRGYIQNPDYVSPGEPQVFKAKLTMLEPAPRMTLRDKYNRAIAELETIKARLADRGIDVEVI